MGRMIRKQVYIEARQEAMLKRLARTQGVSEAELIRQAIDRQVSSGHVLPSEGAAWEDAHRFMLELRNRGPIADRGRTWTRDELYEKRVGRHAADPD